MSVTKPLVVFVLGPPGAGKGTQCTSIAKEYAFTHLSAGDLLREERNRVGSKYGQLIENHIRSGLIVPVEITCNLLREAMISSKNCRFLIDGFPRNQDNIDGWKQAFEDNVQLLCVLFFDASEEVCGKRIISRGEGGSGRCDDNPDSLRKRFCTYMNDTLPIIKHYETQNIVYKIDASRTPEEIFEDVRQLFQNLNISR